MFVRFLGGGIGHGGNAADIETPTVPEDEPDDGSGNQPVEGDEEGDDGAESEDEDGDGEHMEYGKGDIENEESDDEELDVEL